MAGEDPGFLIDGREYPITPVDDFDTDEDQLLWEYTGGTLGRADFVRVDPDVADAEELEAERRQKLKHPGLLRTYLHVAYRRGNPNVSASEIKKLVGQTKLSEAFLRIFEAEPEDDAGPPEQSVLTSEPSEASPTNSDKNDSSTKPSAASSGNGSKTGSEEPDSPPETTGTIASGTSSQEPTPTTAAG